MLVKDLTTGAYLSSQNSSCRSDIGLYLFKVDSKGKINGNDIIYFGTFIHKGEIHLFYCLNSKNNVCLHTCKLDECKYYKHPALIKRLECVEKLREMKL